MFFFADIETIKAYTMQNNKTKSGFFDLEPEIKTCTSSAHDLPKHIVIPQGKGYQHVCPECGVVQIITPTQVNLSDSH